MSLKDKAISGVMWRGGAQATQVILQFIIIAILSRLLLPEEFGLVQMALIVTGFFAVFSSLGLDSAIIQRDDISDETLSTVFWSNLGMGFVLSIVTIAVSPLVAMFFDKKEIVPLICVMAAGFPVHAFSIIQQSLLRRQLNFRGLTFVEVPALAASGLAGIIAALLGAGVWALVIRQLSSTLFGAVLFWNVSKWRPKKVFSREKFFEMWKFSSHVVGFNIVNFFKAFIDKIIIGRYLGDAALGYYAQAFGLIISPLRMLARVIITVAFPMFSQLKNDVPRLRKAYLKIIQYLAFIAFPLMFGLCVLAPEFVLVVWGKNWIPSIYMIQVFSIAGLFQAMLMSANATLLSMGRSGWLFLFESAVFVLTVVAVSASLSYGIDYVAVGVGAVIVLSCLAFAILIGKFISAGLQDIVQTLLPILLISLAMGLFVYAVRSGAALFGLPDSFILIGCSALGTAFYFAVHYLFKTSTFYEVCDIFIQRLKPNGK